MASGPATGPDGRIQARQSPEPQGSVRLTQPRGAAKTLAQQLSTPEFMVELKRALPTHIRPEKMARVYLTALRANRQLQQCTPESFFGALLQCAQLGLEPNTPNGHCYLVPYKDTCQVIVGYQGMIELALRSGKVEKVWSRAVRLGDTFQVKYGLDEDLLHVPSDDPAREEQPITYVYAVAKLTTGGSVFEVLSHAQIEQRRKKGGGGNIWRDHYEAMSKKSAVRALFKWMPKSTEMGIVEGLEQRAEDGVSQASAWSGEVLEGIERMGVGPIDTHAENVPHDPETGELKPEGTA